MRHDRRDSYDRGRGGVETRGKETLLKKLSSLYVGCQCDWRKSLKEKQNLDFLWT